MLERWRATQSNQDRLCQSFIDNLNETPNKKGKRIPKDFCEFLIADLEKLCNVVKGNKYILILVLQARMASPTLKNRLKYFNVLLIHRKRSSHKNTTISKCGFEFKLNLGHKFKVFKDSWWSKVVSSRIGCW